MEIQIMGSWELVHNMLFSQTVITAGQVMQQTWEYEKSIHVFGQKM